MSAEKEVSYSFEAFTNKQDIGGPNSKSYSRHRDHSPVHGSRNYGGGGGGGEERDFYPSRERDHHYQRDSSEFDRYPRDSRDRNYRNPSSSSSQSNEFVMDFLEYVNKHNERAARSKKGESLNVEMQELMRRYDIYKASLISTLNEKYFKVHSGQEWFREKYHPSENGQFYAQTRERKALCWTEFYEKLKLGQFDNISLNEPEEVASTEPATTPNQYGLDLADNATSKPNCLFITGVPMEVKRADLLELCNQVPGFKYLELSEPRPEKGMVRIGWIICESGTDMTAALAAITDKRINDHPISVIPSRQGIPTSFRSITGHANKPSRLVKDLEIAKKIAKHLDSEAQFGEGQGVDEVLKQAAPLLDSIIQTDPSADGEKQVDPLDQDVNVERVTKELDLLIVYLHKVHFFDYYFQLESTCPEDHTRRGGLTARKPFSKVQDPNDPPYWLASLKVSHIITPTPSQNLDLRVDKELSLYIRKEAETKYRCTECQKLFRGDEFVRKHIKTKHMHLVDHLAVEVDFYNFFCAKSRMEFRAHNAPRDRRSRGGGGADASTNGQDSHQRHSFGGDRGGRGGRRGGGRGGDRSTGGRTYHDLDAQKHQNIELNYD